MGDLQLLTTPETQIKVSSTLDKSVGKKYLIDGSPETCWSSQGGTPQYIQLAFVSPVIPRKIHFTFQGGFVGTKCSVQSPTTGSGWETFTQIFPEDVNRPQTFDIPATNAKGTQKLKLVFEASSDFFGRLVVYDLRIEGDIIA